MNKATAIVITSITSFVVFMMSFLLLYVVLRPERVGTYPPNSPRAAKITTDKTVQKLGVTKLSNSVAVQLKVSTLNRPFAVIQVTLPRDSLAAQGNSA